MKSLYMNAATGSVDGYDGWWHENEEGESVNAVDLGEVVEVVKAKDGGWVEAGVSQAAATLGRKGGSARTEAKANAAKANGKKGGRPKKT